MSTEYFKETSRHNFQTGFFFFCKETFPGSSSILSTLFQIVLQIFLKATIYQVLQPITSLLYKVLRYRKKVAQVSDHFCVSDIKNILMIQMLGDLYSF